MPPQASGDGVLPACAPAVALGCIHLRVESFRAVPPRGRELLQVADHPRLEACEQRYPPGGALEAGGSPHRQTGAIRLRLQERIGGRGATIHRQFTQAVPRACSASSTNVATDRAIPSSAARAM